MKILIIGSGAREHAIGYSISKNKNVNKIFFAPGNPGCASIGQCVDISPTNLNKLLDFAKTNNIDYTIVGPEDPLCLGIVDLFESNNLKIFGVSKKAAKLEGSKVYAKDFMIKYNIPTAISQSTNNYNDAIEHANLFLEKFGKVVLKADGLCQGKGVFIAENKNEIKEFCKEIFIKKIYGECSMLIEEFLDGFEMSFLCFVDNKTILSLPTAKDHKKIFDGEYGLNTGGMGTYSPNFYGDIYTNEINNLILKNFLIGINKENLDFRGILFIGLIIGNFGIKVLEFNTRFGDPETQSILQRLETDLLNIMLHTSEEKLDKIKIKINNKKIVSLVLSSGGYPEEYTKNHVIKNLDKVDDNVKIFHAGTKINTNGDIVTNGGRVLTITSATDTFQESKQNVYLAANIIDFYNKYYRKDIGPTIERIYVSKKNEFNLDSQILLNQIQQELKINIKSLNIYQRYDIENINDTELEVIVKTILSEAPIDNAYIKNDALLLQKDFKNSLVVEYHSGQFDQRKQGVIDTIIATLGKKDVLVSCAKVYNFIGDNITYKDLRKIENFLINLVDQKKGNLLVVPTTLKENHFIKYENKIYENFNKQNEENLKNFIKEQKLSMNYDDILLIQKYFISKDRNPTETEIGIIDTYWSDHCRHTTFNTLLNDIYFEKPLTKLDDEIISTYNQYINLNQQNNVQNITLMNLATIIAKDMKKNNKLSDLEVSEENNACSIKIKVRTNKGNDNYLLMFKNETHNHPTEIEPFGGASTCIGGAIRDPLSGRAYVYQSMRITGSADPNINFHINGKLSQKKITTEAARGYSSYGNQIGIATGLVNEIYHEGYRAKRMEVGAVIAAVPMENIKREVPNDGDIILLIGGKTGRDGVGGATGSSKQHNTFSIDTSSSEVQKGNAPVERKIQRLFRNNIVTKMIKKCNDFGAGGISVAIGELADSLEIWLDQVPLKYKGLSYKEITLSESQERMAVVIEKKDYDNFKKYCYEENLEVSLVAKVTNTKKMIIKYNNEIIVDLDRDFINSSGATRYQNIIINNNNNTKFFNKNINNNVDKVYDYIANINIASQKNLIETFDHSIGKGSVLLPLGGKNQITPAQCMCSLIPSLIDNKRNNYTTSLMSYGFNPYLCEENEYLGAYYSVVESICKIAACGGNVSSIRLSFQEYFQKLDNDPKKWSKPFIALLGAFRITYDLQLPVIGGKDSMSGTFEHLNVPSTLISFAVCTSDIENIVTQELKGNFKLGILKTKYTEHHTLDISNFNENLSLLYNNIKNKNIQTCYAITHKGTLINLLEMSFGNNIGFNIKYNDLYNINYGSFIVEYINDIKNVEYIGDTYKEQNKIIVNGIILNNKKLEKNYLSSKIFKSEIKTNFISNVKNIILSENNYKSKYNISSPKVTIPIFPGTNCEYDTISSFENEGAECIPIIFNNLNIIDIEKSINKLSIAIRQSQILVFPGGFSLSDEPDGSGKFIANVIRNPKIKSAIEYLLENNDGLILGICNGFQALIKSGLLPYGKIGFLNSMSPTLTYNNNARHISRMVKTKLINKNSPWLSLLDYNKEFIIPISHGEGRFICNEENYMNLVQNKQIVFEYIDNPNGSYNNIEGIISPCGKILGKMAHTERLDNKHLYKNIPNIIPQLIIKSGVEYFKK